MEGIIAASVFLHSQGHQRRIHDIRDGSAHTPTAADLVRCREGTRWAKNGPYDRRVAARSAPELATLRAQSIKRSASGVSVRSLTVMNPTGAGGDNALTGRTLRRIPLPPKRMTEAGTRPSQRPVSIRRM